MFFLLLPVEKLNNSNYFFQNFHTLPTLIPIGMLKVSFNLRNLDLKADQNAVRTCVHVVWLVWGYFPVPFSNHFLFWILCSFSLASRFVRNLFLFSFLFVSCSPLLDLELLVLS